MEATFTFDTHPDAETLEEYVFERLSEAAGDELEEHILICKRCQKALATTDDYVRLMKEATGQLQSGNGKSPIALVGANSRRVGWGWKRAGIGAAALVAMLAGTVVFWPSPEKPTTNTVQLVALRGGDEGMMAHARRGPLDLVIDVADLPEMASFKLQVVNAAGRWQWDCEAIPADGKLTVRMPQALRRGTYWVRLSTPGGELLREFGLRED